MTEILKTVDTSQENLRDIDGVKLELNAELKNVNAELKNVEVQVKENVEKKVEKFTLRPKFKELAEGISKSGSLDLAREFISKWYEMYPKDGGSSNEPIFEKLPYTLDDLAMKAMEGENGGLMFLDIKIPRGDLVLKLLQVELVEKGYSIMDGNKKSTFQSIDGDFRNDSMHALLAYQREKGMSREVDLKIEKERREQEDRWIKGQFADFQRNLEGTGSANEQLRRERGLKVDVSYQNINITSYGYRCTYDRGTGVLAVDTAKGRQEFPIKIGLDREGGFGKNNILMGQSNGDRLKTAFGLMNLINRGRALSSQIKNKSADNYKPFHIERDNIAHLAGRGIKTISKLESIRGQALAIEVQNGLRDLQLIKTINLEPYAKVLEKSPKDIANTLVYYLNVVHESDYRIDQSIRAGGSDGSRRY